MIRVLRSFKNAYSSQVELVEIDGKEFVLKTAELEEIQNEKYFHEVLRANRLPSLRFFDNPELKPDQILLEYIEGTPILNETPEDYVRYGEATKRMHAVHFPECFRITETGAKEVVEWNTLLKREMYRSIERQRAKKTDLSEEFIAKIVDYVEPRLSIVPENFSLIHCDLHLGNTMLKGNDVLIYDKGSEVFSGHWLYDLAILLTHHPNGTYIETDYSYNQNDKVLVNSFIQGYGEDFITDRKETLDLYMVLKSLSRYPNPFEIHLREIMEGIIS
jgi:Ser/Thr protein kinase RdoA (MazF antagonist)